MAEMYGELMELNERLHRDVASKDIVIGKLASCIRKARIKVGVAPVYPLMAIGVKVLEIKTLMKFFKRKPPVSSAVPTLSHHLGFAWEDVYR